MSVLRCFESRSSAARKPRQVFGGIGRVIKVDVRVISDTMLHMVSRRSEAHFIACSGGAAITSVTGPRSTFSASSLLIGDRPLFDASPPRSKERRVESGIVPSRSATAGCHRPGNCRREVVVAEHDVDTGPPPCSRLLPMPDPDRARPSPHGLLSMVAQRGRHSPG